MSLPLFVIFSDGNKFGVGGVGATAPPLLYFKEVINLLKEVIFKCSECKHWKKKEDEEPCYDCLQIYAREDSHTPLYFEEVIKNEKH